MVVRRLFRRFENEQAESHIFIVSGLPRSGTSMMMMILEAAGIAPLTDYERGADDDNPRGYYEFEPVKKMKEGNTEWLQQAPGKAVKVISALLPYLPSDYHYKVLFMKRSLTEILASQRKMLIRRGEDPDKISDAEMEKIFINHLAQIHDWLGEQKNISTFEIDYNEMVLNPAPMIHHINQFLGGKFDEDKMRKAIEPSLYRQRRSIKSTIGSG